MNCLSFSPTVLPMASSTKHNLFIFRTLALFLTWQFSKRCLLLTTQIFISCHDPWKSNEIYTLIMSGIKLTNIAMTLTIWSICLNISWGTKCKISKVFMRWITSSNICYTFASLFTLLLWLILILVALYFNI